MLLKVVELKDEFLELIFIFSLRGLHEVYTWPCSIVNCVL